MARSRQRVVEPVYRCASAFLRVLSRNRCPTKRALRTRTRYRGTRQQPHTSKEPAMSESEARNLCLVEGRLPADETVRRLKDELAARSIPVFATFDHARNAEDVGLDLRPTTVVVFGSPRVGTALMQADQRISLELPLRIAVWEDEAGRTWLAFPTMKELAERYGLGEMPVIAKMQELLESLANQAADNR
ncbi:DUF302 domain-containing protein [Eggerthella sp. NSJ-70]|uniref:DUF302 domain-containing protein n=2 Tax=Eggerthella hominis TaxID=2763043 RepID=A0ABR7BT03_9ACTN|nr:DUF302 domain-containing protein [Eggerthella hominis]